MGKEIDEAAARDYIRDLYHFVLGRDRLSEREHADWTSALLRLQDPVLIFRKIAQSAERQARDKLLASSQTRYPHGHFYSPVVNTEEAQRDAGFIFRKRIPAAVDMNSAGQCRLLAELAPHFASAPFADGDDGRFRYHYAASGYGYGDAVIYWAMLCAFRPARIIEVGCGSSSVLALDAIAVLGLDTACTFIDPYPGRLQQLAGPLAAPHRVIATPVQQIDLTILDALERDDILFIDSSHVVKTGSDVHFEITEMLPRLKPGVIVHFHDVSYPFEYGYRWIVKDNHSWNETYFLHAFLMYNQAFRIELFNHYLATQHADTVRAADPVMAERFFKNPGAGLWLRRS